MIFIAVLLSDAVDTLMCYTHNVQLNKAAHHDSHCTLLHIDSAEANKLRFNLWIEPSCHSDYLSPAAWLPRYDWYYYLSSCTHGFYIPAVCQKLPENFL